MDTGNFDRIDKILSQNLTREILYKLFISHTVETLNAEELEEIGKKEERLYSENVRYKSDILVFLSLLMDYDLENQIEHRKNAKYDYMIGLLLYISTHQQFKYGFGYFKECIKNFDDMLKGWSEFIESVINDIKAIHKIEFHPEIIIQLGSILRFRIAHDTIVSVKINMDNFKDIFGRWGRKYHYDILVEDGNKTFTIASGISEGNGLHSGLCTQILSLNSKYEDLIHKNETSISLTHGH